LATTLHQVLERGADHRIPAFILACWSRVLRGEDDDGNSFDVTEPRLDESANRLLQSGEPREALGGEPLLASGAADRADFVATFDHYRDELAKQGAEAVLKEILSATTD
jgi:mannitol-1-phosphate/altronate dehydrogenase